MTTTTRYTLIASALAMAAIAGATFTAMRLAAAQSECAAAAALLAEAHQFASDVSASRQGPAGDGPAETDLAQRIDRATHQSAIAGDRVASITPERGRPVDRTAFVEHPVRVHLRRVTLRQFATFVHRMTADDSNVHARAIRLTAPTGDDEGLEWDAEVHFVQFTHDPSRHNTRPGDR